MSLYVDVVNVIRKELVAREGTLPEQRTDAAIYKEAVTISKKSYRQYIGNYRRRMATISNLSAINY
jgi:hypothetical protein